jgi:hypothetical protein
MRNRESSFQYQNILDTLHVDLIRLTVQHKIWRHSGDRKFIVPFVYDLQFDKQ